MRILDPACGDGELLGALSQELNHRARANSTFVGIDQDAEAVASMCSSWLLGSLEAHVDDFLSIPFAAHATDLFQSVSDSYDPVDMIIANPPYVRTQVLGAERAQQLAISFDLTGRVDLYQAFLVAMTQALRPGGLMGVITSNRFLSTKGAFSIRSFLAKNFDILEVIDLGDTKLFEAAVLPAIFIGRKRKQDDVRPHSPTKFLRVYEELIKGEVGRASDSIYDFLDDGRDGFFRVSEKTYKLVTGTLTFGDPGSPWVLVCGSEQSFIEHIEAHAPFRLGDLMHVRVGVKTTADRVFIREDWHGLPSGQKPEPELLRPIIDSSDAKKWSLAELPPSRKILYPYRVTDSRRQVVDLADYPRARSYFEHFRERLEGRTYLRESSREWYEIWVPHHPDSWRQPMLVAPDISPSPKFAYVNDGAVVNGNCYWLTLRTGIHPDYLFLILGIANSKVMTRYHDLAFNNKLYAGRRRYLSQYLDKYPIPSLSDERAARVVTLVRKRVVEPFSAVEAIALDGAIEAAIANLYRLDEE